MSERKKDESHKDDVGVLEKEEIKTRKPPMYKVLVHNDDFTPVPWVISLMKQVFRKTEEQAVGITMQIHMGGLGLAGIYTHEIAETKCALVHQLATRDGHPLMCSMEPES